MEHYKEKTEQVLESLSANEAGLGRSEAESRLERFGRNRLEEAKKDSLVKRFLKQLADPMIIVLLAAAAVSGVVSAFENESFADVFIILAVVIINAVLGVFQESKAEKAIEALQKMSAATSKVFRDGELTTVESELLVPGDVILLEAGDAVPADARIIECAAFKTEEAALTGESLPVLKTAEMIIPENEKGRVPLGDRKNMVYMGSTVVYGRARAVVCETGMSTEMGKIAGALSEAKDSKTPLQMKLSELSGILTKLVLVICVVIFAVQLIKAGSLAFEPIVNSFMVAVSLAVAAIPEGLAAVVTVVLSIGVTNMSKKNAVIRKLTAVETLGSAQIICSDKTGTLTQNKMTVTDSFTEDEKRAARDMALCSDAECAEDGTVTGEPTEAALVAWALKLGLPKNGLKKEFPRVGEAPFDSMRKMMSTLHSSQNGIIQITKGAPDVVIERCTHRLENGIPVPMTDEYRRSVAAANKEMADRALRVLAVAEKTLPALPADTAAERIECDLCFVGLCGMIDPVRPEVKAAIVECRRANVRPIMITGDHPDTASAIARELGILEGNNIAVTGTELSEMSDDEFDEKLSSISVYARVQPEHKTRIVNAWKKAGYITAMTGDGVNDAPSIKSADIGVGMGITGTDVTKNVADMVLADDNFATIVGAVEEGRRIYDNIRKAIQFLLGSNMSEVLSIFVSTLLGFTILKPVHLLWINLITDCFPALALGMEKAEPDIMDRSPRDSKAGIFSDGMGFDIAYQGALLTLLTLASYFIGHFMETGHFEIAESNAGMTMAFLTLSISEIFHSFNMRSQRKSIFSLKGMNKLLLVSAAVSFVATTAVCEIPFLAAAFEFTKVTFKEYAIAVCLGILVIPVTELVKFFQRRLGKRRNNTDNR